MAEATVPEEPLSDEVSAELERQVMQEAFGSSREELEQVAREEERSHEDLTTAFDYAAMERRRAEAERAVTAAREQETAAHNAAVNEVLGEEIRGRMLSPASVELLRDQISTRLRVQRGEHIYTYAPRATEVIQDIADRVDQHAVERHEEQRQALEMQRQFLAVDMELAQHAAGQQTQPPIGDLRNPLREHRIMTHQEAADQLRRNTENRERNREANLAGDLFVGGQTFASSVIAGLKELKEEEEDQEKPPTPPDIQEEPMKISEKDTPALYAVMEGKAPREDCDGCPFNNLEAGNDMVSCQIVGKDFKKGLELTPCDFEKWETKARTEARSLFGGDSRPRPAMDEHRLKEVASGIGNNASKVTDKHLAENRQHHGNRPWRNGDSKADSACPVYPAELKSALYHGYEDLVKRVLMEMANSQGTEDPSKAVNLAEFMILMASLTGRITALENELKEVKEAQSTEVAGAYEPEI